MAVQGIAAQEAPAVGFMPDFERDGVSVVRAALDAQQLRAITSTLDDCNAQPGLRGFSVAPVIRAELAAEGTLGRIAAALAGHAVRPVRVLLFDKTARSNWAVPWHQDRVIAVRARAEAEGFTHWSIKDGVVHVEPPQPLLARMLTLRLLLDDCDLSNAPLQLACATHRRGRIAAALVAETARTSPQFHATGKAGDVLAMRLLTVHRSARAAMPSRRRVLHVDYSGDDLPPPLRWYFDADRV